MRRLSKLNVIVFVMIVAAAISASAKQGEIQKAASVGQTVRGDLTIELESDLRNNSLQGHFAGAEKRAESKDDPGQKLAQLKPSPRQTQQIIHPLLNRLEPELQQLLLERREVFAHGSINIPETWVAQDIPLLHAEGTGGGH